MARIDYYAMSTGIKTVLDNDADIAAANVNVFVEEEEIFDFDKCPAIFIYLERRDAPLNEQTLSAGTRTDYYVRHSLWCIGNHFESISQAAQARDDLIGKAEVALMKDRTLDGTNRIAWLEGGRFLSGQNDAGFIMAGEIIVVSHARATTA